MVSVNAPIVKDKIEPVWDTSIPQIHCYEAGGFISENCGKTWSGCVWMYQEIIRNPKGTFLIAAPSYRILEQSTMAKFFELFPEKLIGKLHRKEMVLRLKSGGQVFFRSVDDPDAIEGMSANAVWGDEAGKMKRKAWLNFLGRVSGTGGRILLTTTPYDLNFVYTDLYKPWKEKKKGWEKIDVFQASSIVNKYFAKDSAEQAQKFLSEGEYKRRYEGSFSRLKGKIYEDLFDMEGEINPDYLFKEPPSQFEFVIGGIDWGFNDPFSISIIGLGIDGNVYLLEEFYKSGMSVDDMIEKATILRNKWKVGLFYAGKDKPEMIQFFNQKGIPTNKANNDITWGISVVRGIIKLGKFRMNVTCENTRDEFTGYSYIGDENNLTESPQEDNNHAMESLRYALASHPSIPQLLQKFQMLKHEEFHDKATVALWDNVQKEIDETVAKNNGMYTNNDDYYDSISDSSI